jgi:hypothetical protein
MPLARALARLLRRLADFFSLSRRTRRNRLIARLATEDSSDRR